MPTNMKHHIGDFILEDRPLKKEIHKNAIIFPIRSITSNDNGIDCDEKVVNYGGVTSSTANVIAHSTQRRGKMLLYHPPALHTHKNNDKPRLRGSYVFGGFWIEHFGHFLLESLSRHWSYCNNTLPILFIRHGRAEISAGKQSILESIGVNSNRIVFIDTPTIVDDLIVGEPAIEVHNRINRNFLSISEKMQENENFIRCVDSLNSSTSRSKYLYVSRNQFSNQREFGERTLEKALLKNNIDVIYPETLKFYQQAAYFYSYQVRIGVSGSSLHNVIFSQPDTTTIHICNKVHNTYRMLDSVSRSNSVFIYGLHRTSLKAFDRNRGPWLLDTPRVMKALNSCAEISEAGQFSTDMSVYEAERLAYRHAWISTALQDFQERGQISAIDDIIELCLESLSKAK